MRCWGFCDLIQSLWTSAVLRFLWFHSDPLDKCGAEVSAISFRPSGQVRCRGFCDLIQTLWTSAVLRFLRVQSLWTSAVVTLPTVAIFLIVSSSSSQAIALFDGTRHSSENSLKQELTFRHHASCILGQVFHYSPENAFYIFNHKYISLSDICLTVHHWYK